MVLGVIGILYGAKLAFAQSDLKRIVSYSSFSHMGYIVLGIFAMNELALQGVVMQMIAHGISSTALFAMIGFLETRLHTRDVNQIGGLYSRAPVMGGVGLIFVMASLGLPGLGNFIAEFLVLMGAYQADILLAVFASIGLVLSSLYALRLMQNIFYGQVPDSLSNAQMADFRAKEGLIMGALIVVVIGLGFYPQPVFDTAQGSIKTITQPDQRPSAAQTTNQAESSASQAAKSELILKQNL